MLLPLYLPVSYPRPPTPYAAALAPALSPGINTAAFFFSFYLGCPRTERREGEKEETKWLSGYLAGDAHLSVAKRGSLAVMERITTLLIHNYRHGEGFPVASQSLSPSGIACDLVKCWCFY